MAAPKPVEFVIRARDQTRRAFRRINRAFRGLVRRVLSLRSLLTGVFAGAAVKAMAGFASGIERVTDAAEGLRLKPDEFEALNFAAGEVGESMNDMSTFIQNLRKAMGNATSGEFPRLTKAFLEAGVSLEQLQRGDVLETMDTLFDTLRSLPAQQANSIFGRLGVGEGELRLVNKLSAEFANFADIRKRAVDSNAILSPEARRAAEEFSEKWREIGNTFKEKLAPVIEKFNEVLTSERMEKLAAAFEKLAEALVATVEFFGRPGLFERIFGTGLGKDIREAGGTTDPFGLAEPLANIAEHTKELLEIEKRKRTSAGETDDIATYS